MTAKVKAQQNTT